MLKAFFSSSHKEKGWKEKVQEFKMEMWESCSWDREIPKQMGNIRVPQPPNTFPASPAQSRESSWEICLCPSLEEGTAPSGMVREWKDIECCPKNSSYSTAQGLEDLCG